MDDFATVKSDRITELWHYEYWSSKQFGFFFFDFFFKIYFVVSKLQ